MAIALILVAAGAAIWWHVGHEKWSLVRRLVFWVVLVAVVWVVVNRYAPPLPEV